MKEPSLRFRLLVLSVLSVVLVLSVAGLSISTIFANHVQRSFERGLSTQLERLVALVNAAPDLPRLRQPMADARYDTPGSGVYWQVTDPASGAAARSRSLWDTTLPVPASLPEDGASIAQETVGASGEVALAIVRALRFDDGQGGERPLVLMVAEATSSVSATNSAFQADLLRALAIIGVALIGTSWLQVQLGLAPLSVIKRGISTIRSGQSRTLAGRFPAEVMPLVSEVNELLAAQERSIRFARDRAADLAHGLKTGLTRLNMEAHGLREMGRAEAADRIETLTAEMAATIDHQLRLARLRHRTRSDFRSAPLEAVLRKVMAAVRSTPEGGRLDWRLEGNTEVAILLDVMDLTELLGVILENAAEWAATRVAVNVSTGSGQCRIVIEDDGPGLDDSALSGLGQRGRRLDEARPGSGIGLAIAREIVDLNSGTVAFARAPLGGLSVTLTLGVLPAR